MLQLERLFRAEVALAPAQEIGDGPLGRRRIIPIAGGEVSGARLSGRVLPGGVDWQTVRPDGVAYLDARYAWLNRTVCVGSVERLAAAVRIDFYAVK